MQLAELCVQPKSWRFPEKLFRDDGRLSGQTTASSNSHPEPTPTNETKDQGSRPERNKGIPPLEFQGRRIPEGAAADAREHTAHGPKGGHGAQGPLSQEVSNAIKEPFLA